MAAGRDDDYQPAFWITESSSTGDSPDDSPSFGASGALF
jgi:hypothetical protein